MRRKKFKHIDSLIGYAFLLPNYILYIIFGLLPIIIGIVLSFYRWNIVSTPEFIGMGNFIRLFTRDIFIKQVTINTIYYLVIVLPAIVFLPLVFAILLSKIKALRGFFQSIYFVPIIISPVVVAIIWRFIYSPNNGILNFMLLELSVINEPIKWLNNARFSLLAIMVVVIWKMIPLYIIFYLSNVRNIQPELYESAKIDGCRELGLFKYITLPFVRPTMVLVFIHGINTSFWTGFAMVKVLTEGRPINSTNIFPYYIYQRGIEDVNVGYASTISLLFFIFFAILSVVLMKVQQKGEQ